MRRSPGKPAKSTAERTQRDLFAWSLLAAVLLLAAMAGPFFAGRVYTRDDLGAFHLPTRSFYAEQLARSEPFDWMPHLYSGFYLTGEGQAGTYHPLHWLLYRYLPLRAASSLEWLSAYPFMLVGTWLFMRRRLLRRDAAMLGAVLFTFCSFNLLHFLHPNAVAIVAHIPWLLWTVDIVIVDCRRARVAMAQSAIALLTGSQLLLGYPQYVWLSLVAGVAYAGFVRGTCVDKNPGSRLSAAHGDCTGYNGCAWVKLIVALGCGLLLGAVQLLPTVDALANSARRSAEAAFAYTGSLHPLNLIQLVAPYTFPHRVIGENTHELGLYVGAVPLMLVAWLVARRASLGPLRPLATAAGIFAAVALLMALGRYGVLYRLQAQLPIVGSFRYPCRYLVLFQLAVSVLAAIGFVVLIRDYQRSRDKSRGSSASDSVPRRKVPRRKVLLLWRRFEPLWIVVGVAVVVASAAMLGQSRGQLASLPAILAGPLVLGAAALLTAMTAGGFRWAPVGLILLATADLGLYGLSYAVYPRTALLEDYVARTNVPPGETDGRLLAAQVRFDEPGPHTGNQMTLAGWHRADGYAGLKPRRLLDYRSLPALRAAGVRWVRHGPTTKRIENLIPRGQSWREVPRPLDRVRMVGRIECSDNPARDLGRIDLETTALAEVPIALPKTEPGSARLLHDRPGRLVVGCEGPAPQMLVIAESFHPGWQARVDQTAARVWRINGDFMGCLVGAGEHVVVLEFRPRSLHRGRIVSCLGLGLVAICFVGYRLQPNPSGPKMPRSEDPARRIRG